MPTHDRRLDVSWIALAAAISASCAQGSVADPMSAQGEARVEASASTGFVEEGFALATGPHTMAAGVRVWNLTDTPALVGAPRGLFTSVDFFGTEGGQGTMTGRGPHCFDGCPLEDCSFSEGVLVPPGASTTLAEEHDLEFDAATVTEVSGRYEVHVRRLPCAAPEIVLQGEMAIGIGGEPADAGP